MSTSEIPTTAPAVQFDEFGGIEVLTVVPIPVPAPGDGEVLVQVRAAGLNPGEIAIRGGAFRSSYPSTFPSGEGTDFAGVVVAIGAGVPTTSIGDEVIGWSEKRSSQASYVVVPKEQVLAKPRELDWPVAGSLFMPSVTGWAAVDAVKPVPGDTVVVSSAGGGVGSVAAQLAGVRGARVIGIASEADAAWLASHDIESVPWGDGLAERIRVAAPEGVDAFIDTYGSEYLDLAVELGVARDRIETIIAFEAAQRLGAQSKGSTDASNTTVLGEMVDLIAAGRIEVRIGATFPLAEVRAAFELLEHGKPRGRVVLIP